MAGSKKRNDKDPLEESVEALEEQIRQGKPLEYFEFPYEVLDVREIRESLGLSRQQFAFTYGLSLRTIQNWEDNRRQPEGPAKSYLAAIKYAPQAVAAALRTWQQGGSAADAPSGPKSAAPVPEGRR